MINMQHKRTITLEIHLSGLILKASHPGMQKTADNWIFIWKKATLEVCSSAVTIYSMYPRLNLSTTPDLQFYKP